MTPLECEDLDDLGGPPMAPLCACNRSAIDSNIECAQQLEFKSQLTTPVFTILLVVGRAGRRIVVSGSPDQGFPLTSTVLARDE